MRNRDRKYLVIIAAAFIVMVGVEFLAPRPVDWTRSFEEDDARPYGSRILYEQLPALFPGAPVTAVDLPPYLVLGDSMLQGVNYLFVAETYAPDRAEAERLLDFVGRGNTAFVAALMYTGPLADTLGLETDEDALQPPLPDELEVLERAGDTTRVNFVNPALRRETGYHFGRGGGGQVFQRFDTVGTTVLGVNDRGEANFIRVPAGSGAFYLSTLPSAFTNYHMLEGENAAYAYTALSYLPLQRVFWDAHYKPLRLQAGSPLRFILISPALRWAYYVLLASLLLFLVFEAKRRQRVIPVVTPLRNTTVAFVETVGRLYHQHGDHANLAAKKAAYFFDYVRTRLNLATNPVDDRLVVQVAERSGVGLQDVRAVFEAIAALDGQPAYTEAMLVDLNRKIEAFYAKSRR